MEKPFFLNHLTDCFIGVESVLSERHLVFDSKDKVRGILKDLAKADLGVSIIVSGLRAQVAECCKDAGLKPHTVCQSMGIWGNIEKLPHRRSLEITSMCGHGRISPNLVWDFARKVKNRGTNAKEASRTMGKLCLCNIFNEVRSEKLLQEMANDLEAGIISPSAPTGNAAVFGKDSGITIDQSGCTGCKICLPYCPVSAIVDQ